MSYPEQRTDQRDLLAAIGVLSDELFRKEMGSFSVDGPTSFITDPMKDGLRRIIDRDRSSMGQQVMDFKRNGFREDFKHSPALFTAYYLATKSEYLRQAALNTMRKSSVEVAATILDARYGYDMVLTAVLVAGNGIGEESPLFEIPQSIYGKVFKDQIKKLLAERSDGFSVIDWEVDKLREASQKSEDLGGVMIRTWQVPELVIAGAEIARDFYKEFYPRAHGVLRAHPSRKKTR